MTRIAIIGAGIAGLTAAHRLQAQADVQLFEKSWRAGGRVSTRHKQYAFDHGAQHFYVKTAAFREFLTPFIEQGLIRRWDARFVEFDGNTIVARRQWGEGFPHYVASPGMTDFGQTLARGLKIQYQTRVTAIVEHDHGWRLLSDETPVGDFDWVIMALPAPQVAALMPACFSYAQQVSNTSMQACYSLMLGFPAPIALDFDAALVRNTDISWISVNSSKPGRPEDFTLLVHSTNRWADDHLELAREAVIEHLSAELARVIQLDIATAEHVGLHRWLYANIGRQQGPSSLVDQTHKLAAVGDWCISGRVESAFTSGHQLNLDH
ncbi:MAG: FAD-dependent oxidoreductase [Gammaproteobacteria bacterium]|nr:FAD-dependent oxidoreductase [Gammaproteobacteria bacterium]